MLQALEKFPANSYCNLIFSFLVETDRVSVDTTVALTEIRSQLHELTRSVENCQSEVYEVKHDMMSIKHEIDSVQFVKDEIDDIRDSLDRLESEGERRKAKLLEQVIDDVSEMLSSPCLDIILGHLFSS